MPSIPTPAWFFPQVFEEARYPVWEAHPLFTPFLRLRFLPATHLLWEAFLDCPLSISDSPFLLGAARWLGPQQTHYVIDIQVSWLSAVPRNSLGQGEGASTDYHPPVASTFHALLTSFPQQPFQVEILIAI